MSHLIGEIKIWSSRTVPDGFLLCDGAAVSRSLYSGLFAIIGATYGAGDGSSTFNLPNLQDVVPMGLDMEGGTLGARDTLGASGSHTHTVGTLTTTPVTASSTGEGTGSGSVGKVTDWAGSKSHSHAVTGATAPASAASSANVPPNIRLPFIICFKDSHGL